MNQIFPEDIDEPFIALDDEEQMILLAFLAAAGLTLEETRAYMAQRCQKKEAIN